MTGRLQYVKDDLFTTDATIIAHAVNCRGVFNAGIAKQIRQKYPPAYEKYLHKYQTVGWKTGQVQFISISPQLTIANMAMQDGYGRNGCYVQYYAVAKCFELLLRAACAGNMDVAIPKVGSGLGGGSWEKIESILCRLLCRYPVNIRCYVPLY